MWYGDFRPYVSVAERRRKAKEYTKKLAKKGRTISPVELTSKKIAVSFWGRAWCDNLEAYSDFANRLPRGRTYVRNGSVVDLQIRPGKVEAIVSGSEIYDIAIDFKPLDKQRWKAIKQQCAGQISSLVELLQGKFSDGVMGILTDRQRGMFPAPKEISLDCSCPDWADMCKHVAAVLYGVGSRLDQQPELFFTLRQVDQAELIDAAGTQVIATPAGETTQTIASADLADVFGIELDGGDAVQPPTSAATAVSTPATPAAKPQRAAKARKPAAPAKVPVKAKRDMVTKSPPKKRKA